jgi:uncharacterized protein
VKHGACHRTGAGTALAMVRDVAPLVPGRSTAVFVPPDARQELDATVAALRRPDRYPRPVGRVDTIETHMSWVFLAGDRAYKLKKPQRTRWFDHTTADARRRSCEQELRLNRRLSPEVYLRVVPVVGGGRIRAGGRGRPIDWLLEMRRLPAADMLDAQIARRRIDRNRVRRAASLLSGFYLGAEPAGWSGPRYLEHLVADAKAKVASLAEPRYGLDRALIDEVNRALRHGFEAHAATLEQRAPWVADLHGDLRPEHVYVGDQPAFIDCLDFDRLLRLLDPVSELAFLALETGRLGAPQVGRWFLDTYRSTTGDDPPAVLWRLYHGYHALVRAAVAIWHLDDTALDHSRDWRGKALRYLELGRDVLQTE